MSPVDLIVDACSTCAYTGSEMRRRARGLLGASPENEMHRTSSFFRSMAVTSLCVVAFGTTAGCARRGTTHLEDPVGETHTTSSSTGGARAQGTDEPRATIDVVVTEEIRVACRLQTHARATRFSFDGPRLRPNGDDSLSAIARCLATDSLADRALQIVGFTDPRGTDEYTDKLGLHRADAAKQYLVDHGVAGERIAITSKGSRESKGTNEATWQHDRRVELSLAEPRSREGLSLPTQPKATTTISSSSSSQPGASPSNPSVVPPPQQSAPPSQPQAAQPVAPPAPAQTSLPTGTVPPAPPSAPQPPTGTPAP